MMEEMLFRIMVIVLSLILLVVVAIILAEIIAHRKENDSKRFRPKLKYMRTFKEGYAFSDDEDLSKAMQIMYITGDCIEFSDTGIDGKYEKIWSF